MGNGSSAIITRAGTHNFPQEAGWYGLSIGFLQENWYKELRPDERSYDWLKGRAPDFRVGDSIFVYYISPDEIQTDTEGPLGND